ncbi:hypothetical protein G7046_g9475 [Stylonectria norvegica]|nr:hypothetical protein G7046_g9475 [Stylonectria norvegica]
MGFGSSKSDAAASKPRTRQRAYKKPPVLAVPNIDQDAAERKRVLNVLAQRRYREKKRFNRLKKAATKGNGGEDSIAEQLEASIAALVTPSEDTPLEDTPPEQPSLDETALEETVLDITRSCAPVTVPSPALSFGTLAGLDLTFTSWDPINDPAFTSLLPDSGLLSNFMADGNSVDDNVNNSGFTSTSNFTPSSGFTPASSFTGEFSSLINPPSRGSMSNTSSDMSLDSYVLPVNELTLIRAMVSIASRIGTKGSLWGLDAVSSFYRGEGTPSHLLPVPLRPTASQLLISHHPMLDLLPWPGVRDRMINILTLPDELRPPNAVGPLALVNFAYDVEDSAEGVRIYGEDPLEPEAWEIGQVMFEQWWFLFDRKILETSNRWRRMRGAPPLLLKGQSASPRIENASLTSSLN